MQTHDVPFGRSVDDLRMLESYQRRSLSEMRPVSGAQLKSDPSEVNEFIDRLDGDYRRSNPIPS
jgi:hypothetical protein